ncbi:MAG TPA: hypothetical protein VJ508_17180 [Saprospiraceae bacterium]|nr:hypothetical protein [Saprospiraceae bacterium]
MTTPSKLVTLFSKPLYQVLLVATMTIVFTLVDKLFPHDTILLDAGSGTWVVATAMVLCYIILNSVVALRIEPILPYWSKSVTIYIGFLVFTYAWCYLLTGKQIDDVGSFRWLWLVLTLAYMVFFVIARSMKRIVDLAIKQDEKMRGED